MKKSDLRKIIKEEIKNTNKNREQRFQDALIKAEEMKNLFSKKFPFIEFNVRKGSYSRGWVKISIDSFINDAPYDGYSLHGHSNITSGNRKYLGKTLFRVASFARKNGISLLKDYNKFYLLMPY